MAAQSLERPLLVDVHTHVYLPSYMEMLRERTEIPLVHKSRNGEERIILLKEEVEEGRDREGRGRPVGPQFWDRQSKLEFMDLHGIDISIVSLANPWLDFLSPSSAVSVARELNADINTYCLTCPSSSPSSSSFTPKTSHRLFAFGSLPLVPGVAIEDVLEAIDQIKGLSHVRGVVMGTKGLGKGLDDPEMDQIWKALAQANLVTFIHPHYGIENAWGDLDNGHVLPLALGFPFETSIAIARLILSGTLDRHPTLKLLLAHSAGALPALSSRLASCVIHDPKVNHLLKHDFRYYLGLLWYDSVAYGSEELGLVERVVARSGGFDGGMKCLPPLPLQRCQMELIEISYDVAVLYLEHLTPTTDRTTLLAPKGIYPGVSKILFGTDHPFFPPLNGETRWTSVDENLHAVEGVEGWSESNKMKVLGGNAVELFELVL